MAFGKEPRLARSRTGRALPVITSSSIATAGQELTQCRIQVVAERRRCIFVAAIYSQTCTSLGVNFGHRVARRLYIHAEVSQPVDRWRRVQDGGGGLQPRCREGNGADVEPSTNYAGETSTQRVASQVHSVLREVLLDALSVVEEVLEEVSTRGPGGISDDFGRCAGEVLNELQKASGVVELGPERAGKTNKSCWHPNVQILHHFESGPRASDSDHRSVFPLEVHEGRVVIACWIVILEVHCGPAREHRGHCSIHGHVVADGVGNFGHVAKVDDL